MLKKLLTGCLTIAAAAALAFPAMGADMSGKVNGRAIGELNSSSLKAGKADAVNKMDMGGRARFGYDLTATEGDWTVTGTLETYSNFSVEYGDTALTLLQKYIKLENDAFSVSLGTQWWGLCYMSVTGAWTTGETIDRSCYGVGGTIKTAGKFAGASPSSQNSRDDRAIVTIKSVGLAVMAEMNYTDGDTTTDQLDESAYGLKFDRAFGPVGLSVAYVTKSTKANDKVTEKTAGDGAAYTELTLGVTYMLSEAMGVEFDYEAENYTPGTSGAKTQTGTQMGLAFSMALSESQGFLVGYDSATYNSGVSGAKDFTYASITADFIQKIAGQKFYVGYKSDAWASSDPSFKTGGTYDGGVTQTQIVLGSKVMF